jgi:exopolysaccharide biosynthesis polyprenyl glycosylphosphotransferase
MSDAEPEQPATLIAPRARMHLPAAARGRDLPPLARPARTSYAIHEGLARGAVAGRERAYRRALLLADTLALLVALALSVSGAGLRPAVLLLAPLHALGMKLAGLYDRDELLLHKTTIDEAPALVRVTTLSAAMLWLLESWMIADVLGKPQFLVLWLSLLVCGLLSRHVARGLAHRAAEVERCLVVGDPAVSARLEAKLRLHHVKAELVGSLTPGVWSGEGDRVEETMRQVIRARKVHRLIVVPSHHHPEGTFELVRAAKAIGVRVSLVPQVVHVLGSSVVFDDVAGMTLFGMRRLGLSRSSRAIKRALDLVGSSVALVAVAPALALVSLAIRFDSPGPALFRQDRIGRNGRPFRILKFRTMVADAEARKVELLARNEADGLFKIAEDPRITRVGHFLRRTSLDELPQLLNVLRGEMSLVGPRPLIAAEDETITGYDRTRLQLTPGMTGPWQILGSSRIPLSEMVKLDYLYVAGWSLWGDLKILLRTVPYVLARRGL